MIYNIPPPKDSETATYIGTENADESVALWSFNTNTTNNNSPAKRLPPIISATELREPLLESGTVDVYDVDSDTVTSLDSTRISSSY